MRSWAVNDSRKQQRGKCLAWGNPDLFALQNTAEEEGADQNCFIVADPKGWKLTWELLLSQEQGGELGMSQPGWPLLVALLSPCWALIPDPPAAPGVQIQILCNCTQDQVTEVTTEMNKSKCLCLQRGKKVNPPTKTLNDLQMENVPFIFYLCRQIAQYELSFCQGQWWPVHGNPWQLWNKWNDNASAEGMCSHGKWPMGKNKNYLNLSCLEELSGDIISSRDWEIHFLSPPLQSFHCINGIC